MNLAMPCMSIFSKMKLKMEPLGQELDASPKDRLLTHGLNFKVFFNSLLKMFAGSFLGTGNLPFLLAHCFSGPPAVFPFSGQGKGAWVQARGTDVP